jgi:hypothetical protein
VANCWNSACLTPSGYWRSLIFGLGSWLRPAGWRIFSGRSLRAISRLSKAALRWSLRYSKIEEFLSDLEKDSPQLVGPEFKKKPHLENYQQETLDAFFTLAHGRQSGMGANPISLADIEAMIRLNSALPYEPMELIAIWRELDAQCLQYWEEEEKAKERRITKSSNAAPS